MCCRYKLSLTSLTTFIAPGTTLQVYAGICLAGFFWIVDAVAQPFENSAENALQIFAQGVIFFTLAIGGMVQTGGNNDADVATKQPRLTRPPSPPSSYSSMLLSLLGQPHFFGSTKCTLGRARAGGAHLKLAQATRTQRERRAAGRNTAFALHKHA